MWNLKNIFGNRNNLSKKDIKSYLNDELTDQQKQEVEEIANASPLNSDALDGFEQAGAKSINGVPSFDDFLKDRKIDSTTSSVRKISPFINKIAAVLIGVVSVSALFLYWNENKSERTFAEEFETYEDPKMFALRDGTSNQNTNATLQKATTYYLEEDYKNAIVYFETFQKENKEDIQSSFYLGVSHLQEKNTKKAIPYLSIVAGQDSEYKDAAQWFLALAHVKMKNEIEAKMILEKIQKNASSFYSEKAKELLERL